MIYLIDYLISRMQPANNIFKSQQNYSVKFTPNNLKLNLIDK